MGYEIKEFARMGLHGKHPVDLGTRCTVFMNSSVKQAQKNGASMEDISAGLWISVVKNALYKVIRAKSAEEIGKEIVVQGGTFLNDTVLRSFELELGRHVIRPGIAHLMGAYGAALLAKQKHANTSSILDKTALENFTHTSQASNCGLCTNHCNLTLNTFADGTRHIAGNKCERPIIGRANKEKLPNLYDFKYEELLKCKGISGVRGKIGIPLVLNMYDNLPFWHSFFTNLGFEVVLSDRSSKALYAKGQHTISSDTICYPAKLVHGHIQSLIDKGIDTIFYPCMSYNFDEKLGDNHYNCPVVAYYPEVISANMANLRGLTFIHDYVGIHRKRDFPKKMHAILAQYFDGISLPEVKQAAKDAYAEYDAYMQKIREKGDEMIAQARAEGKPIIILSGRPYHLDPEINHGIDKLITSLGAAVISEDVISAKETKFSVGVLNQWTYHARLYAAAEYVGSQKDMNLVQLVSFGCGVDAITTDEVRSILESHNKIYTQIKIDEITNLGAVKIRLRSLFAALEG